MQVNSRVRIKSKEMPTLDGRHGAVVQLNVQEKNRKHIRHLVRVDKYPYERDGAEHALLAHELEELLPMDETLQKLAATAMSTAHMADDKERRPRTPARHKLVLKAEKALNKGQLEVLVALLEGRAALVTVAGKTYAVRKTPVGHAVRGLGPDDPEHNVVAGACSCEDARFRGKHCKHLESLEALL